MVERPATSEPAPGSLNIWHQISSLGEQRAEVPALLLVAAVGHDRRRAHAVADRVAAVGQRRAGRGRAARSPTFWSLGDTPSPPKPSGKCTHAEAGVVLRAEHLGRAGRLRVVLGEELVAPIVHELLVGGHGVSRHGVLFLRSFAGRCPASRNLTDRSSARKRWHAGCQAGRMRRSELGTRRGGIAPRPRSARRRRRARGARARCRARASWRGTPSWPRSARGRERRTRCTAPGSSTASDDRREAARGGTPAAHRRAGRRPRSAT